MMQFLFRILAVVGSAMFAGVMLAVGAILSGYWKGLPPAGFLDWFAQHSELVMRAIPLAAIPTVVGLIAALCRDWKVPVARGLWLAAGACVIAVLGLTMSCFMPSNAAFVGKAIALDQAPAKLDTWLLLHNVRIALALAASVLGIVAVNR